MQGAPAPFKTFGSIGGGHWVAAARLPHMPPGNLDWCEQKKTHWFIYLSRRRFLYEKTRSFAETGSGLSNMRRS
jgi:hypothetical protein